MFLSRALEVKLCSIVPAVVTRRLRGTRKIEKNRRDRISGPAGSEGEGRSLAYSKTEMYRGGEPSGAVKKVASPVAKKGCRRQHRCYNSVSVVQNRLLNRFGSIRAKSKLLFFIAFLMQRNVVSPLFKRVFVSEGTAGKTVTNNFPFVSVMPSV